MTKVELFNPELQESAAFFKALGHPARLAILQYLAETRVCMTGDISNELPLSRTTVNQHLRELKDLRLIKGEIDGTRVNYCLDIDMVKGIRDRLTDFLLKVECCNDDQCKCK
jgi:DNA-binding transcriptional ArsR family regulator